MGLPIRSTGLDVYINRVLITDKATAEIELACCHKTGSVLSSPPCHTVGSRQWAGLHMCVRPDTAQLSRAAEQAGP